MAQKKTNTSSKNTKKSLEEQEATEAPIQTEEKPQAKKQEPQVSIEQVAMSHARELSPRFKQEHLSGLLAFCKSSGLPSEGTEARMLDVLKRYGYKI